MCHISFREQQIYLAKAEAIKIELKGEAEAFVIGEIGKAEAKRMSLRADAFKKYGKTAILNQIIDSMPRVAAEVTSPLQRTKNITIIDGGAKGGLVSEIAQLIGSLPPTIQAITGVDITNVRFLNLSISYHISQEYYIFEPISLLVIIF